MLRNVYLTTLRRRLRGLLWWSLGVVVMNGWIVGFYPSIRESAGQYSEILEGMPEGLRNLFFAEGLDLGSPEGYLSVEAFSFVVPILLLIYAIGFAASTLAGEEQGGQLDVVLANPVSRRRVVTQKAAAMATGLLVLGVVLWGSLALGGALVGMSIPAWHLLSAVISAVLLAWAFGGIALVAGALTGRRALAMGVASTLAVFTYLLHALAPLVDALEPFRVLSPFTWYLGGEPLLRGLDPADAAALLGLAVAAWLGAAVAFDRRDLAT